ncbi:hypothetical protein [Mucilaginibacter sp.]|uniref:hypothetical protein n=1 Tax=Mucilaginibacter sp. TaxID=1882438 RepID=UPI0035BBFE58
MAEKKYLNKYQITALWIATACQVVGLSLLAYSDNQNSDRMTAITKKLKQMDSTFKADSVLIMSDTVKSKKTVQFPVLQ